MVFKRAIVAELSNTFGAVFTVLFSIIFSVLLVRILGQAAGGTVDNQAVFALVALTVLTYLPTVLTLTLFITVLLVVTRAYRDSEMVVWLASGQSLLAWLAPVLRFSAPVVLLVAALSLVVSPWSSLQIAQSKERFSQRDDVSRVAPGRFIESSDGSRVFFVETSDIASGIVRNVFVSHRSQGREGVIVAAEGVIKVLPEGDRYLVLQSGRRYEGVPGEPSYRLVEFASYSIRIDSRPDAPITELNARNKPSLQLWRERSTWSLGELLWRIGLPAVTLMLALLAVPLAHVNPRVGRSANLIVAVLAFMLYHNGMSIVQAWVQQGRMPFALAVWLPHALVAAIVAVLFLRRVALVRWLPAGLFRRAARGATAGSVS
jgi:lipopolysaccharide export system permease protein